MLKEQGIKGLKASQEGTVGYFYGTNDL